MSDGSSFWVIALLMILMINSCSTNSNVGQIRRDVNSIKNKIETTKSLTNNK